MKKIGLFLVFIAIIFTANAQDVVYYNNFKLAPTNLFFGGGKISYEYTFDPSSSFTEAFTYGYLKANHQRYTVGGVDFAYRYYTSRTAAAPLGWYGSLCFGGVFGYMTQPEKAPGTFVKSKVRGTTIYLLGGYQWLLKKNFIFDVNAGLSRIKMYYTSSTHPAASPYRGELPVINVGVGYAFK